MKKYKDIRTCSLTEIPGYPPLWTEIDSRYTCGEQIWKHISETRKLTLKNPEKAAKALGISRHKVPCDRCIYRDAVTPGFCGIPFSDLTIEASKIDPCYDGVLRYIDKNIAIINGEMCELSK